MIHIRQSKYNKDRYVPLSPVILKGLRKYYYACQPVDYLFNGKEPATPMSTRGLQWVLRETLSMFAIDPKYLGAMPGMVAVLHTWGQNLSLHPHLHCLVPAGGVSVRNKWVNAKNKAKYLFPVKAMSIAFRAKYTAMLKRTCKKRHIRTEPDLFEQLYQNNWVVYTKRPFKGVNSVLEYLGRYTHRIV